MPSTLRTGRRSKNNLRHLNLCFSNFKHPFTHEESPPPSSSSSPTAKSSSFLQHNIDHHNPPSPSSTTTSSIMIKNFNSLYDYDHTLNLQQHYPLYPSLQPEPEPEPEPADFATAFASQRFFFSSPGRSNSIIESTTSFSSSSSPSIATALPQLDAPAAADDNNNNKKKKKKKKKKKEVFFNGSVAVPTYSPDPYLDFRRSMEEMVEARPEVMMDVKSNWEVLHELLLCYLALNSKSTHKFILGAFADLLVSLMSFSSSPPPPQNPDPDYEGAASGGGGSIF